MSEGGREQVGHRMRAVKERHERHPELVDKGSAQLVVLACEVGGRWDSTGGPTETAKLRI